MRFVLIAVFCAVVAFAVSPGDIVVNEIMFNGPESGTDNEWVELHNTTASGVLLDSTFELTDGEGSYLFEGVTIPANGYLTIMVAENDSVPFPFVADIDASEAGILLANSADDVILNEGTTAIDNVTYDDDWGADGDGKTLERIDPAGPSSIEENWGPSLADGGTPGAVNSIYDPGGDFPPEITDIMHTPEFPISTDDVAVTADITDDGTITKAVCFYSIDGGSDDSLDMAYDGAHGDGAAGDDIWGAIIDAQPAGSEVRYYLVVEDDGAHSETTWVYAYFVTTGDTIDGDLVVNEIMYNPASPMGDNNFEYIEFYNRGSTLIDASDWIVKDDNDFNTFVLPAGTEVAAGEFLVIAKNADSIEAHYSITDVVGSVGYSLNNTGDAVRLYDPDGTLMDYVYFLGVSPWPTEPDGNGPSLSLISATSDNNDATNWEASSGDGTPGSINTGIFDREMPESIALLSVRPNPFNSSATASFMLPEACEVELMVYDISGRLITRLIEDNLSAGQHSALIELNDAATGIYLIKLHFGEETLGTKALLVK